MNKVQTAAAAISAIKDGMTIGIGGWGPRRKPMALIRELLRSDSKDFTIVSYGGADVGMLCAAGKVKKLIFAFVSLDFIPLEPFFRIARQSGDIDVMEIDEGLILMGLRAAAWRIPFIPTRVGLGTDVVTRNTDDLKIIDSPYDHKDWLAMPALHLDVSLIHVNAADQRGVCQIKGPDLYMDDWFARAAKHTIVSCEELVPAEYFSHGDEARHVHWERTMTQSLVHLPGGAHPSSCNPCYGYDQAHLQTYAACAKDGGFGAYSARFLSGADEADYQRTVGGLAAISALPLPVY